jgi:hypothetical protein
VVVVVMRKANSDRDTGRGVRLGFLKLANPYGLIGCAMQARWFVPIANSAAALACTIQDLPTAAQPATIASLIFCWS